MIPPRRSRRSDPLWLALALLGGCEGPPERARRHHDPPEVVVDSFLQELISPVDLVWVIDRGWTAGMSSLDQDTLNDVFETLLLADPSWQIGVLDSTAGGADFGLLRPQFSTWPGPDPFEPQVPEGESRVREAVHLALDLREHNGVNHGFIRSDAALYVVVFTGDKDRSQKPGTDAPSAISREDFDQWFTDFEPSDSQRLSVITTADLADYWSERLLGGGKLFEVGSVRKALTAMLLDAIGQRTTFALSRTPAEPPTTVRKVYRDHVTDYHLGEDYRYEPDSNAISFLELVPEVDSTILVTYEVAPEDPDTAP